MSSAVDVEIWDKACQEFDNSSFDEAVRLFNSMGTVSSKISFNVGSVYLAKDNIRDALKVMTSCLSYFSYFMFMCLFSSGITVETRIEETCFFLSSLDMFISSGLVFLIPACMVLNKVLIYTTCFACIYTAFSTRLIDDYQRRRGLEPRSDFKSLFF